MRKLLTIVSLLVALSLALTACGGGATPTQAPAATEPAAVTEAPAAATEAPVSNPGTCLWGESHIDHRKLAQRRSVHLDR